MASTESEPSSTIVNNTAGTSQSPSRERKLRRKRHDVDYSLPEYEALFNDSALLNSSTSTTSQPLKKCKISNLKTVLKKANQEIHTILEAEFTKIEDLQEEVQRLKMLNTKLQTEYATELTEKSSMIYQLKTKSGKPSCVDTDFAHSVSLLSQRPVHFVVRSSLAILLDGLLYTV
ncbi:hypothetical protein ACJ73_10321 [Blastomyces percursus]|uniref:Uncharacterized protein n=1 Tax=Blastomyces percursus TaxID=1658174 RepID=A0A1J9PZK5_9EURO|nr:hypothetical protein ACJ73_10321 [Blastomyces percursus]